MKTETMTAVPSYAPGARHPYYAVFLKQDRGQELLNLMWISLPHDKRGLTDLRDSELVKAMVRTTCHSLTTCEYRNPYEKDPAGNVSSLLCQPPEVFAEWLNKLDPKLRAKLPLHQHLGDAWVTTVNQRLALCNKDFDAVEDVSLAAGLLAKFSR